MCTEINYTRIFIKLYGKNPGLVIFREEKGDPTFKLVLSPPLLGTNPMLISITIFFTDITSYDFVFKLLKNTFNNVYTLNTLTILNVVQYILYPQK